MKILYVKHHSRTSLQIHKNRDELWKVLEGFAHVELEDRVFLVSTGDAIKVSKNMKHRITTEDKPCAILEISLGEFNEKDVVRIQDDYNRL